MYNVADKVIRVVTDDLDEQIITVKCEPKHARALERGCASITTGRYLDKRHWIKLSPRSVSEARRVISRDGAVRRGPKPDPASARGHSTDC
ncbi:hypothetical protein [Streptomyces sp. NPDC002172]